MEKKNNSQNQLNIQTPEAKPVEEESVSINKSEYIKLKESSQKANDYWERLLRLQADFDNAIKRFEKQKQEIIKFANEEIILELLNILDDLERSLELAQKKHQDFPAFLKGIEMILVHLYEMLKKHGLKPIEAKGKPFDPHFHEALLQVEDDSVEENTVLEELQKGYLLNDKVIRTAKVKVSKKSKNNDFNHQKQGG